MTRKPPSVRAREIAFEIGCRWTSPHSEPGADERDRLAELIEEAIEDDRVTRGAMTPPPAAGEGPR